MTFNLFKKVGGLIGKAASFVKSALPGQYPEQTASISQNFTPVKQSPQPLPGPSVFNYGTPGAQNYTPAQVVPSGAISSGPYQNYSPVQPNFSGPNGPIYVPPPAPLNYTPVKPNFNGPQGPTYVSPTNPTSAPTTYNTQGIPLTGFGGAGGYSAGQFGGGSGTGIQGAAGGAALLPGSLSTPFRSSGTVLYPTTEEEKKKKQAILAAAENRPSQQAPGYFDNILSGINNFGSSVAGVAQKIPILKPAIGAGNIISNVASGIGSLGAGAVERTGSALLGTAASIPRLFAPTDSAFSQNLKGVAGQYFENAFGPTLSEAQKNTIASATSPIATSQYQQQAGSAEPSVKDLVNQAKFNIPSKVGTESDTNKTFTDQITQVLSLQNNLDNQVANNTIEDQTLKSLSDNSQQLFGRQLDTAGVRDFLTKDTTGAAMSAYHQARQQIESKLIDPTTGEAYKQEWSDPSTYKQLYTEGDAKQLELDKLKEQQTNLETTNPYLNQTVQSYTDSVYKNEGVLSTQALISSKQKDLDAVLGVFEGLAEEVRNDPDFSKKLKANRLNFLNDKQKVQADILQRELNGLKDDLKTKLEFANDKIKNVYTQYQVYANERNFVQNQINTINSQIEKASDNARASFNSIASNPDFLKGATQDELNREYDTIQKLGYIPLSMLTRLSKNTGKDVKSVMSFQTTANTKTVYGLDSGGKVVYSFTAPDVSQAISKNSNNSSFQDIGGSRYLVTYNDAGSIVNKTPIGPATSQSPTEIRNQFLGWLPTVKDLYTKDQLNNVIANFAPTYQSSKDTALKNAVETYATSKGGFLGIGASPQTGIDPIEAFNTFNTSGFSQQGAQLQSYNITGTNGSAIKSLTPAQAQLLQSKGYTVTPQ